MRAKPEQFVTLDFEPTGFHAVCEGRDCGDRNPYYRVVLGRFTRFFCEECLTDVLLEGMPVREARGSVPHALDPKQGGYMNPGGEF